MSSTEEAGLAHLPPSVGSKAGLFLDVLCPKILSFRSLRFMSVRLSFRTVGYRNLQGLFVLGSKKMHVGSKFSG